MGFYKADLDRAEKEIRVAIPDVKISRFGDYGYRMVAIRGERAITVFQPERRDIGQEEIITTVPKVISYLNEARANGSKSGQ